MNRRVAIALFGTGLMIVVALFLSGLSPTAAQNSAPQDRDADAEEEKSNVAGFMRAKLASSQSVLEGLVIEDFEKVREGAQKMVVMSKAADWQVVQGPVYAQYSGEFRRLAQQLVTMAKAKNLDGAALSYMQLTMNCISCHNFVRSSKIAAAPHTPEGLDATLATTASRFRLRLEP